MDYERSLKIKWDNYATLQSMHDEGVKKGIQQGLQEGMQKGAEEKSYHVVKNLILKMSLSDEQAASIADVSIDFVRKVRTDLHEKRRD